jgi:hypothetical protein
MKAERSLTMASTPCTRWPDSAETQYPTNPATLEDLVLSGPQVTWLLRENFFFCGTRGTLRSTDDPFYSGTEPDRRKDNAAHDERTPSSSSTKFGPLPRARKLVLYYEKLMRIFDDFENNELVDYLTMLLSILFVQ